MPFNGSGTFAVYTPGNPVVTGTIISDTVANATNSDFASGLSNAMTRDGQGVPTANIPMGSFKFTGLAAGTVAGNSVRYEQVGALAVSQGGAALTDLRSYLAGCGLSTAGASATMSIAAGAAQDSTNVFTMALTAIAKTTSAWAVGTAAGGLDTGAIANSTWYHFYVIRRPDTGVVDVVFSTNATTPTLPTNYTQYRRIGSGKTNGSAQWTSFIQYGDDFFWLTAPTDTNATNPGTAAVSRTLSTPLGVKTKAHIQLLLQNLGAGGAVFTYVSDLATTDVAASNTNYDLSVGLNGTGGVTNAAGRLSVWTNTSSQIRSRINYSDAVVTITINTIGWTDTRGKDA